MYLKVLVLSAAFLLPVSAFGSPQAQRPAKRTTMKIFKFQGSERCTTTARGDMPKGSKIAIKANPKLKGVKEITVKIPKTKQREFPRYVDKLKTAGCRITDPNWANLTEE